MLELLDGLIPTLQLHQNDSQASVDKTVSRINPSSLASYRRTFTPSGAKDDPTDAAYVLDLLLRHPDQFRPLEPQSVEMRALMTLVDQ